MDDELSNSPYRDYWEVQDLYLSLLENDEGPFDLDPYDQMALMPLALSDDHGSGHARAWLTILGGSFPDHVVLPTHDEQRSFTVQDPDHNDSPVFINVHPNPSNGPVVVVMNLPKGADGGLVRITDPQGRLVHEQSFQGEVQLLELDTRGLTTGVYAADLVADGIRIGVAKFELVR